MESTLRTKICIMIWFLKMVFKVHEHYHNFWKSRQEKDTLMANRSPVVIFLAKKTRPNAPRLIGFIISKSSMDVRSLLMGWAGLARKLRTTSSSSSIIILVSSNFSRSIASQSWRYFSLQTKKKQWRWNILKLWKPNKKLWNP